MDDESLCNPNEPLYRELLESTYCNLIIILTATNRPAEADEISQKADALNNDKMKLSERCVLVPI